jgi:hypothetical protein
MRDPHSRTQACASFSKRPVLGISSPVLCCPAAYILQGFGMGFKGARMPQNSAETEGRKRYMSIRNGSLPSIRPTFMCRIGPCLQAPAFLRNHHRYTRSACLNSFQSRWKVINFMSLNTWGSFLDLSRIEHTQSHLCWRTMRLTALRDKPDHKSARLHCLQLHQGFTWCETGQNKGVGYLSMVC